MLTSGQKQTPELIGNQPHRFSSTLLVGEVMTRRAHIYGVVRQRSGWAACELFEVVEGSDKGAKWYFTITRQLRTKKEAFEAAIAAIAKAA